MHSPTISHALCSCLHRQCLQCPNWPSLVLFLPWEWMEQEWQIQGILVNPLKTIWICPAARRKRHTVPSTSAAPQLSGTTAAAEALAICSQFWSMYRVLDLVICAGLESLRCILPRGPEYSGHSHWFPGARHIHAAFAARQNANLDPPF